MNKIFNKLLFAGKYVLIYMYTNFWNFYYKLKYYDKNHFETENNIILIHVPKTAGTSVKSTLGIKSAIHAPAYNYKNLKNAKLVIFVFRNPFERIESIFKYSRNENHKKMFSPLFILNYYDNIDEFIQSTAFLVLSKCHYFFQPMSYFFDGIDFDQKNLVLVDFDNIEKRFFDIFKINLKFENQSSSKLINKQDFSIKKRESYLLISKVYQEDILFYNKLKKRLV